MCTSFHFGFKGVTWDRIVLISGQCLSIYLVSDCISFFYDFFLFLSIYLFITFLHFRAGKPSIIRKADTYNTLTEKGGSSTLSLNKD